MTPDNVLPASATPATNPSQPAAAMPIRLRGAPVAGAVDVRGAVGGAATALAGGTVLGTVTGAAAGSAFFGAVTLVGATTVSAATTFSAATTGTDSRAGAEGAGRGGWTAGVGAGASGAVSTGAAAGSSASETGGGSGAAGAGGARRAERRRASRGTRSLPMGDVRTTVADELRARPVVPTRASAESSSVAESPARHVVTVRSTAGDRPVNGPVGNGPTVLDDLHGTARTAHAPARPRRHPRRGGLSSSAGRRFVAPHLPDVGARTRRATWRRPAGSASGLAGGPTSSAAGGSSDARSATVSASSRSPSEPNDHRCGVWFVVERRTRSATNEKKLVEANPSVAVPVGLAGRQAGDERPGEHGRAGQVPVGELARPRRRTPRRGRRSRRCVRAHRAAPGLRERLALPVTSPPARTTIPRGNAPP